MAPLHTRLTLRGARAAILGTGGAARAVAVGLGAAGAVVTVHARNTRLAPKSRRSRTEAFARGADPSDSLGLDGGGAAGADDATSWDLLVNTTPIGTFPAVTDTPVESLARVPAGQLKGRVAYDLVYNPRPTRLLRDAAAAGCATLDGLDMLVEQAARQFEWWTGRKPSTEVMRAAAERRLTEMAAEERQDALAMEQDSRTRRTTTGMKQTTFEEFVELATARHVRAGLQRGDGRPASRRSPPSSRSRSTRTTRSCWRAWKAASTSRAIRSSARTRSSC